MQRYNWFLTSKSCREEVKPESDPCPFSNKESVPWNYPWRLKARRMSLETRSGQWAQWYRRKLPYGDWASFGLFPGSVIPMRATQWRGKGKCGSSENSPRGKSQYRIDRRFFASTSASASATFFSSDNSTLSRKNEFFCDIKLARVF